MRYRSNNVFIQTLLVVNTSKSVLSTPIVEIEGSHVTSPTEDPFRQDSEGNYPSCAIQYNIISSVSESNSTIFIIESSLSGIPVVWDSELTTEYNELGQALSEMKEIEDLEEGIEPRVFEAAANVATQLMANNVPAPRIFTHGRKSVVFNWTKDFQNLYFTISADKVSALVSIPAQIQRRIDYPLNELLNPALLLKSLAYANQSHPIALLPGSVLDSTKILG
jgi:hypothetical protein